MDVKEVFSKNLCQAVKESDLNFAKLAKRINVTKATMSMYAHAKALPSLETFLLICNALDVNADYLLGRKDY